MQVPVRMLNKKLRTTNNGWYFILGVWFGRKLAWDTSWPVAGRKSYNKAQYKSIFSHVKDPVGLRSVRDTETEQHSTVMGTECRCFGQVAYALRYHFLHMSIFQTEFKWTFMVIEYFTGSSSLEILKSDLCSNSWGTGLFFLIIYLLYFELWHLLRSSSLIRKSLKDTATATHTITELRALPTKSYRGADKSLTRPGRKQATGTEDFDFHISYL